ncbi:MAG: glycerol-3-phosphate acyltransferase [Chloroflexi bacterium]|nr:glycerol-3-phosphate acyltransferase [Chloroflexota bacterium]
MPLLDLLYIFVAYLVGSLPVLHLLARRKGVDLRQTGTGNVGGGNLWQSAGPGPGSIGIAADVVRGFLAPSVALFLGLGPWTASLAAIAAVTGQMWPVFLRLSGGRGNATGLAAMFGLSPPTMLLGLIPGIVAAGLRLWGLKDQTLRLSPENLRALRIAQSRSLPLGMLLTFSAMPLAALVLDSGTPILVSGAAIAGLVCLRRITADLREDLRSGGAEIGRRLLSRLLYDRPVP